MDCCIASLKITSPQTPIMKFTRNPFFPALGLSLAACLTANAITWDGGSTGTDDWSGGGNSAGGGNRNWDTNNAPVAGNPLIFAGTTRPTPNNNTTADTSYAGITFDNTAGAFVLGGNRITLGGNVTNDDTQLQTINMAMILSGNRTFNANAGNITVGGVISGSGFGIIKTGSNTLTLNVSNTYTGTTDVQVGTLALGANDIFDNASFLKISGGILDTTASNRTDTVSTFEMTSGSLNGGGTITATTYGLSGGTVTANLGTGTLNVTGTVALNGTSAASAVNVSSGSLTLGSANRLANAAAVAVSGGALAIAGFDDTVGAVSLTGGSITGSGGTLTGSSYAVQSGSISAILGGAGIGLTKTTAGTVSLSAANTYTGATTIQAGTLQLLTGGSLASLSIIVGDTGSTSAVLDAITSGLVVASGQTVSGIGTIKGSTTIQSGGAISPGNSAGILTNLGNISLDPNSTFQAEINGIIAGTGYDQLNVTGASSIVTLGGLLSVTTTGAQTNGNLFFLIDNDGPSAISGAFSNAPINGNTYTFGSQQYAISYFGNYTGNALTDSFIGGNDVVLMAVPEPGAALLGGVGLLCLLRRRRNG